MFELLDVYERLEIALKLKRGRLQKAKGGGYAGGGAPFGYECLRGGKKLYVNATEAKAVRRVFEIKQSFPDMTLKSVDENENPISKSAVADWIMENYYNDRKFVEYCKERKGKILETAEQAYKKRLRRALNR